MVIDPWIRQKFNTVVQKWTFPEREMLFNKRGTSTTTDLTVQQQNKYNHGPDCTTMDNNGARTTMDLTGTFGGVMNNIFHYLYKTDIKTDITHSRLKND